MRKQDKQDEKSHDYIKRGFDYFIDWYQNGREVVEDHESEYYEGVLLTDDLSAMPGKLSDQSLTDAVLIHALCSQLVTKHCGKFLRHEFNILDSDFIPITQDWVTTFKYTNNTSVRLGFMKRWSKMKLRQLVVNFKRNV